MQTWIINKKNNIEYYENKENGAFIKKTKLQCHKNIPEMLLKCFKKKQHFILFFKIIIFKLNYILVEI